MTREEALEILNTYDVNFHNEDGKKIRADKICAALDMAIEALKAKTDDWIPVKWHAITEEERKQEGYPDDWTVLLECPLPNDGDEILITLAGRGGKNYVEKDTCYVDDGWHLDSGYSWVDDVIAWMPKPEPYKAESEGI